MSYQANLLSTKGIFKDNCFLTRETIGTMESVNAISENDIYQHFRNTLCLDKMSIVIAGDFDSETLINYLNTLSGFNTTSVVDERLIEPIFRDNSIILSSKFENSKDITLQLSIKSVEYLNDDKIPLLVLSGIIAGTPSSLLSTKLRYNSGLVYGVGSSQYGYLKYGLFSISTSFLKINIEKVLALIKETFDEILAGGIKEEHLNLIKNRIIKSEKFTLQTVQALVDVNVK